MPVQKQGNYVLKVIFKEKNEWLLAWNVSISGLLLQDQMEMKVKQLTEASRGVISAPEASHHCRRSLPSTPSEDMNTWSKFNMSKELEAAKQQLKLKDQEIFLLRQKQPSFKSSLQIAERSKNSSISFENTKTVGNNLTL